MADRPRERTFGTLRLLILFYSLAVPVCAGFATWLAASREDMTEVWIGTGVLSAGLLLLAVGALLLLEARVVRPVRGLVTRVEGIARGELEGSIPITRDDELGRLQRAVNEMAAILLLAWEARVDREYVQGVVDSMPDALVVLDSDGVVEMHNRKAGERLGRALVGASLEGLFGTRHPEWYVALLGDEQLANHEVLYLDANGASVPLRTSGTLVRDADGRIQRVVLLARERREVEELHMELEAVESRLQDSERFFQNLFDAMTDPITVLAPSGEILQANRSAREMFGADIVGRRCYRAFRMRTAVCEGCPALATLRTLKPVSVEHRIFGNAITRISTYPLRNTRGEVEAIINHKRDVTKERKLEDLKAAFLAGVSHELRTPLTSIVGFNKLNMKRLSQRVRPALEQAGHSKALVALGKALEDMAVMDAEGERLGRLVNDVLDLSKLEAGKLTLGMTETPVPPMVENSVAATAALWKLKKLTVNQIIPVGCPPVWGDGDRLSQVLVNLLSNAIKFTAQGGIEVRVSWDESFVRFDVQDSGRGIPPEETPYVFEKFRQVAGRPEEARVGTGLGLPICRELIRLHEGRIWVESKLGQGSTFSFTVLRADRLDEQERSIRADPSFVGF